MTRLKRQPRIFEDRVEILLTRGQVAVVDVVDADLAQFNWTACRNGEKWYAYRRGPAPVCEHMDLHRVIAKRMGMEIRGHEREVDHRDGDGLNCRRGNLRPASSGQNKMNGPRRSDNTSGYKGVGWDPRRLQWRARIKAGGQEHWLGYFPTAFEAGQARSAAASRLHGDFARM